MTDGPVIVVATLEVVVVLEGETVVDVTAGALGAVALEGAVVVGETPLERPLGPAADVAAGAAEVLVDVAPAPFEVGEGAAPKVSFAGIE